MAAVSIKCCWPKASSLLLVLLFHDFLFCFVLFLLVISLCVCVCVLVNVECLRLFSLFGPLLALLFLSFIRFEGIVAPVLVVWRNTETQSKKARAKDREEDWSVSSLASRRPIARLKLASFHPLLRATFSFFFFFFFYHYYYFFCSFCSSLHLCSVFSSTLWWFFGWRRPPLNGDLMAIS